jgi:hypothetical protein
MEYLLILLIGEVTAMSVVALLHLVTALGGEEFSMFAYPLIGISLFIIWLVAVIGAALEDLFR